MWLNLNKCNPQLHTAYTLSEPLAPIAQGIERRSPEAEAQVRFLLGARELNRTTKRPRMDYIGRHRCGTALRPDCLRNSVCRDRLAIRFLLAGRQHPFSDGPHDGYRHSRLSALARLPDVHRFGLVG